MIQPIPRVEPKKLAMPAAEFERLCQRAAQESVIRNAKLGFPAVSCESGQIVFSSPERVLAELGVPVKAEANDVGKQSTSRR